MSFILDMENLTTVLEKERRNQPIIISFKDDGGFRYFTGFFYGIENGVVRIGNYQKQLDRAPPSDWAIREIPVERVKKYMLWCYS